MTTVAGLRFDTWPDRDDQLACRVLLQRDEMRARAAWEQLARRWNPDQPTSEQYRLFPLLAERLAALMPDEARLGMLQGVRRQATVQTLFHLDALDDALGVLETAGLAPVVLKGSALALTVYDHLGQRPFGDADVMVDPRMHARALAALVTAGFVVTSQDFGGNHAVGLAKGTLAVDLHRRVSRELALPGEPERSFDIWQVTTARRSMRSGRQVTVLAPADALVHTVVHGTAWSYPINVRWIVDAQRIVDTGDVDGDRVAYLARRFGVSPVVHDALVLLGDLSGRSVPEALLGTLAAHRLTPWQQARLDAFHRFPTSAGPLGGLPLSWSRLLQRTRDRRVSQMPAGVREFISVAWGVEGLHQVPAVVLGKAWSIHGPTRSPAARQRRAQPRDAVERASTLEP